MTTAIIDLDMFKYSIAGVGEDRSVLVTHKETKWSKEFKTRTLFYGHHKKKAGGWLAELNSKRLEDKQVSWEDFTYEDIQRPQPIENVLHSAKLMVEHALEACGAKSYKAFMGKGKSFRHGRSTLLEYKGNRNDSIVALHLEEVSDYLAKKYKAEIVTEIESDDACVMAAYKQPDKFVLGEDKDFFGCPVNNFNVNMPERGIVDCNKFGKLWRDAKGKVRGEGRIHFYWQVLGADSSDNYKAHCFSDVTWGEINSFNALVDTKDDKEALESIAKHYKLLYPEPKEVIGWRGNNILIDWKYVFNECFDMARMLRFEGDEVVGTEVMSKLGIEV